MDRVRADISWTGGPTGTMKTARLAEACVVNCEVHTSIFHGLDLVNLHCIGVMRNCEFFELLNPIEPFCFGLTEEIPIKDELAFLPQGLELGISFYLNQINNLTIRVF